MGAAQRTDNAYADAGAMQITAAAEAETETKWSPRGIQRQISSRMPVRIQRNTEVQCSLMSTPVLCLLFCCLWYGALIYGIYYGADTIATGSEYADSSTEETCEIVGVESESCSYSYKHDSDSTCYGTKYSYTAFAREKCGEDPLYISDFDKADCPGSYFAPQQT